MEQDSSMTIVFLRSFPLSQRDYDRYGIETIKEQGINVQYWDLTEMLNKRIWEKHKEKAFKFPGYHKVPAMNLLKRMFNNLGETIFIDVLGTGFTCNSVRNLVKKKSCKICVMEQALLPNEIAPKKNFYAKITFKRFLEKFRIYGLLTFPKYIINSFNAKRRPSVDYRLMSGTASLPRRDPHLINAQKIWTHSLDYNLFLLLQSQKKTNNTIVFIDNGINGTNSDFSRFNAKPFATMENYNFSMRRVFDVLEKHFNTTVVIAGHPKGNYKNNPNPFGKREVHLNKTGELIRDCKLVISTGSTADSFAVLWNKPILFITTDEIANSPHNIIVKSACQILDTQIVNVDHDLEGIDWLSLSQKSIANYDEYRNKIIKKDGTPKENSWKIFVDFLMENMNQSGN
jgi:hypothetical protein